MWQFLNSLIFGKKSDPAKDKEELDRVLEQINNYRQEHDDAHNYIEQQADDLGEAIGEKVIRSRGNKMILTIARMQYHLL